MAKDSNIKDPLLGQRVSSYRMDVLLGRGAMGRVYQAHDVHLNRTVAVKVLDLKKPRKTPEKMRDAIRQFVREGRSAAQLSHPHVVGVFEIGEWGGYYFIVMEYVDGDSLSVYMRKKTPAETQDVIRWGIQSAHALAHAHDKGVIHRDVKPSNLMCDQVHNCHVADFGLASISNDDFSLSTEAVGTPTYMAPELLKGEMATSASDQFSLAASLLTLLSGGYLIDPRQTRSEIIQERIAKGFVFQIDDYVQNIPQKFYQVLQRALSELPEDRFEDCEAFARALEDCQDEDAVLGGELICEDSRTTPEKTSSHTGAWIQGWGWALLASAAVVGMLVGFLLGRVAG